MLLIETLTQFLNQCLFMFMYWETQLFICWIKMFAPPPDPAVTYAVLKINVSFFLGFIAIARVVPWGLSVGKAVVEKTTGIHLPDIGFE